MNSPLKKAYTKRRINPSKSESWASYVAPESDALTLKSKERKFSMIMENMTNSQWRHSPGTYDKRYLDSDVKD